MRAYYVFLCIIVKTLRLYFTEFSAKQIADLLHGEIVGNKDVRVHTFAKIEEGVPGTLSFLSNPKYYSYLYTTQSSIVLVNKDLVIDKEVTTTLIKVENAYESVAQLLALYQSSLQKPSGISSLACISDSATIGKDVYIAPFVVIGENTVISDGVSLYPHVSIGNHCKIGSSTTIYSNCSIYDDCSIGNNCILHAGCVIGADGFGFAPTARGYEKIPQIGNVVIEDHVEIGANTCIDRSTMGSTVIHKGTKLDNLIQIAHNVEVGEHTVMAAQVGIAGSTKIGKNNQFGGQVGVAGHITIGDNNGIGAQSGIPNSIGSNMRVIGAPAINALEFARQQVYFKRLPEMANDIKRMKKELEEIKNK